MERIIFKGNEEFKVSKDFTLDEFFSSILTDLYEPLVGKVGLDILNYLYKLEVGNHSDILRVFNLSSIEFISVREKLEAVSLIKTYVDGSLYLYKLKKPLSYKKFFNNEELVDLLRKRIYSKKFEELKNKSVTRSNFKNISKHVNEVYVESKESKYAFDIVEFNTKLVEYMLDKSLFDDQTMYLLNELYKEYNLDLVRLFKYINFSVRVDKIDIDNIFNLVKKDLNKPIKRSQSNKYEQSSIDYLRSLSGGVISKVEENSINKLIKDTNCDQAILNVVIEYSLKKNNGRFIKNYIEPLLTTLMRNNINSYKDALLYFDNLSKPNYNEVNEIGKEVENYQFIDLDFDESESGIKGGK